MDQAPIEKARIFPNEQFELLVRSYLDKILEWEVVHNFAMAHIDDLYLPEYQRPIEDLHFMFFPEIQPDIHYTADRNRMTYLLALLDQLKEDVKSLGAESVRERERARMDAEVASKTESRSEVRNYFRSKKRKPEEGSVQ
jgi:hypothetical protein